MRSTVIGALALSLTFNLALAVSGARAETPTERVQGLVDGVILVLKDPAMKGPAAKKQRRERMKKGTAPRCDYEEMARRSLGRSWGSLNGGQRQEFVRLFGELLEASYADKIENYHDEKVQYLHEDRDDGDYAEVRTVVLRKNDRIPLNYRMIIKDQGWMIYDVVIEGVSLVSNYRSQFGRVISEGSYGELVRRLRAKITELQKTRKL